jgi:signal transduction histidine kinase
MLRVLGNLMENSIKYSPPGSSITLRVRESAEDILVSVSDDGPGMSVADQMHAFERRWQGRAIRNPPEGSGLGLSIVRDLVEQNNGSVVLFSQAGRGTHVTIRLPNASSHFAGDTVPVVSS